MINAKLGNYSQERAMLFRFLLMLLPGSSLQSPMNKSKSPSFTRCSGSSRQYGHLNRLILCPFARR